MSEQNWVNEKQCIQLKRIDSLSGGTAQVKYALNKILMYGELLYVKDENIIIVGDGSLKADGTTVSGSTVKDLYNSHKYFKSVLAPTFYASGSTYPALDATPVYKTASESKAIVNQKYVSDAIASLDKAAINVAASKTLKQISESDGIIDVKTQDINIAWGQVSGDKPIKATVNPTSDGDEASIGSRNWEYALSDHIHAHDTSREAVSNKRTSVGSGEDETTFYFNVKGTKNYFNDNFNTFAYDITPNVDAGAGSAGNSPKYSRGNHVHPTDTSREAAANKTTSIASSPGNTKFPTEKAVTTYVSTYVTNALSPYAKLNSPTFTGTPKLTTTPATTSNDTTIASTAFVQSVVSGKSVVESKTAKSSGTIYVTGVEKANGNLYYNSSGTIGTDGVRINCATGVLLGAAWNDFAEYRKCRCKEPGTVVCEIGNGWLELSKNNRQAGAYIISDTYGMVIGQEDLGSVPVAVAGRVLAKYSGAIKKYTPGRAVCAGPGGKIKPMSRWAVRNYPDRILGYVSEIPDYDTWNNVKVDNRVWIKVV